MDFSAIWKQYTDWLFALPENNAIALAGVFVALFSGALGAWVGSYSASALARKQKSEDLENAKHDALLETQYALMSQWDVLEGVRTSYLNRFREHKTRFLVMPSFHVLDGASRVPFDMLGFIVTTKNPNFLHSLHIAEQSYLSCLKALDLLQVQKNIVNKSENIEPQEFDVLTGVGKIETKNNKGKFELYMLKEATDIVFNFIDKTLPNLEKTVVETAEFSKLTFPKMGTLQMISLRERIEKAQLSEASNNDTQK